MKRAFIIGKFNFPVRDVLLQATTFIDERERVSFEQLPPAKLRWAAEQLDYVSSTVFVLLRRVSLPSYLPPFGAHH